MAGTPGVGASSRRRAAAGARLDRVGEVLDLVRSGRSHTLSELAASTGLARSTVAYRVEHLLAHGLIRAAGDTAAQRGRPAAVLEFNPAAGAILAAQLGMTGARVAVTDLAGDVLAGGFTPAPIGLGPHAVLDQIEAAFDQHLAAAGLGRRQVRGIGIGLPSAIELSTARSPDNSAPPRWAEYSVTTRLEQTYAVPVLIDSDLNLLALAEQRASWPDAEVFLCLKVGTVIGCGIVIGGQAVRGAQAMSGGIGHTRVAGADTPCLCGSVGCLDAVAGGGALAARLAEQSVPAAHAKDVARLAREGVVPAVQAVRGAGRDIGEVLAAAVNLLNPSVVAVWGYLVEAEEPLFAGIREAVYQRSLPAATRSLLLVPARLGDNAGVRGAAAMVIDEVLSPAAIDRLANAHLG